MIAEAAVADAYDVVVIGAGTGGYVAAIRAAQLGLRTAVVERSPSLGGTCLNLGCIPTKALLEHAHVLKLAQESAEWGISFGAASVKPTIDLARVHTRKNKIVTGLTKGVEFLFKKHKIDWVKGTARLAAGGRIDISGPNATTLSAREIVIATGSAPRSIPGVEIDGRAIVTSDEAVHVPAIPKSIAILGSGAVGVEFASIFSRFGSEVTLIELLPRIVPNEDEAISAELAKAFRKRGVTIRTGTTVTSARVTSEGVSITMEHAERTSETLTVEKVLVATGRRPVTDGLGAVEAGLVLDRGFVKVDDLLRTNIPGMSAIGDVITTGTRAHPQLAHLSSAEGILVAERIAGRDVQPINYDQVPSCTYCEPEIGSVGLTEREAAERGFDVNVGTFPFGVLGRAKIVGETEGFVKIVSEKRYDEVLGVHMIGARATELVAGAAAALRLESTVEELVRTIHPHPTMSEAIGEAAHAAHGGAIHL
jgi:dihydrolipoamide dehydrogenase